MRSAAGRLAWRYQTGPASAPLAWLRSQAVPAWALPNRQLVPLSPMLLGWSVAAWAGAQPGPNLRLTSGCPSRAAARAANCLMRQRRAPDGSRAWLALPLAARRILPGPGSQ